ncbi:MAG: lipopolysaccharide heptosyltransferase I [Planctomycetota bacterium]|nr:MAG: lipopolysaccharide heptosyltransferase I [Planctomycetota bacterium]
MADMQSPPRRILIIKPSSLGDIVHALPVLAALRRANPRAHIAWLVGTSFAPLLDGHPMLDEIIPFDRRRYGRMWYNPAANIAFWRFVAEIRRRRFDLIVDLQGLIRSGLLAWFSGARRRVGFAEAREGAWLFYTQCVRSERSKHAVERNLDLGRALGLPIDKAEFPLTTTEREADAARRLLYQAADRRIETYVAVLPGTRWPSKNWPAEHFAALIDRVHDARAARCVLLGAAGDRPTADAIREQCRTEPVDLVGRTDLRQLVALLAGAAAVVSCDSGPLHVAAALQRPTVAIFGPTDPRRTGPYAATAKVVTHRVNCAPCLRRRCPLKHHDCLLRLTPDAVFAALDAALRGDVFRVTAPEN